MNAKYAQATQTTTRQFEHCGHLMMLVRLPALTVGDRTQSQRGWCCVVCGTTVDLHSMSIRDSRPTKAGPRRFELIPGGLQPPRQRNDRPGSIVPAVVRSGLSRY
jgi:hypothetical protein